MSLKATTSEGDALCPREREALALLCKGLRDREIAVAMGIGVQTVYSHVQTVYRKIGATNRAEAAYMAGLNRLL